MCLCKKNVRLQFCLNKKSLIYKLWEIPFSTTCISGIFYLGKIEDVHFFYIEFFLRFLAASEHLPPLVVGEDVQNITILYFNSFFWIPHEILVKKNVIAPIYNKFWNLNILSQNYAWRLETCPKPRKWLKLDRSVSGSLGLTKRIIYTV